jgi:DNA-binding MarR family transcriptional regulator
VTTTPEATPVADPRNAFAWVEARWEAAGLGDPAGFLALGALLRAHATVTTAVDRVLRGCDLSRTGYLVLMALHLADDGTRSHGRLARDLLVHPTTITLVTDQLVAAGLVRRRPDPADRRSTLSTVTAKGRRAVVKATDALAPTGFGFGATDPGRLSEVVQLLTGLGEPK